MFSIKNLGIARTNVFVNLIPVLTAIFSFFLLQERFSFLRILGVVIVVTGLMFSQLRRKTRENVFETGGQL